MSFILRSLTLYLAALTIGAVTMMFLVPVLAVQIFGTWMPWRAGPDMAIVFGYYCFIRGWLLWIAAGVTATLGFFMGHHPLRHAILMMPAWAPLCYVVIYMMLVAK